MTSIFSEGGNILDEKQEFKPYVPADKVVPEFTVTSVVIGILLAVLFGGANAYLGLRVGMTVSASIPADQGGKGEDILHHRKYGGGNDTA